jgi:DNA-binding MarR family transcriptional regulator/GNAT superfamily N-acetyltransferase
MGDEQVRQIRSFTRVVTQIVRALEASYLDQGRPLRKARLLFEISRNGSDARRLREGLGLDSGYLSRLVRSLGAQGLVEVCGDRRLRRVALTEKGLAELAAYESLSDRLASSILAPLAAGQRCRLVAAMAEVERLLEAASVEFALEPPTSADAEACLDQYYRELAARFEGGFDPIAAGAAASASDMIPPQGFFLVAKLRGAAVGCGGVGRAGFMTGEIKRVWIAPKSRGVGLATRLIAELEARARALGLSTLRLDTNSALKEAQNLYRKLGYREVARFNANPYAHHWFEKLLQPAALAKLSNS